MCSLRFSLSERWLSVTKSLQSGLPLLLLTTRQAHGPTSWNSPGSGFTDFCFRKDMQAHFTDYIGLLDIDADGHSSSSSTAHCCHSRQRGRHCPNCSSCRSATASARSWSSHRRRPQSRLHTLKYSIPMVRGCSPLVRDYSDHSPLFLPDPQRRGRPLQLERDGAELPFPPARPAWPQEYK